MLEGKDLGEVTDAAIAGAGRGLLDSTVDYAISTGNKFVASADKTSLTDAGETLGEDDYDVVRYIYADRKGGFFFDTAGEWIMHNTNIKYIPRYMVISL